jgi:hypothetical protein
MLKSPDQVILIRKASASSTVLKSGTSTWISTMRGGDWSPSLGAIIGAIAAAIVALSPTGSVSFLQKFVLIEHRVF